jgi:hypothetical protein
MADQDLKLNVTATATGDGLRKTAEEVKNLNAETAKSAPLALEVKTREEQLAAVRERHAEAARQQAAAEAELDAKREEALARLDAARAAAADADKGGSPDDAAGGGASAAVNMGMRAGMSVFTAMEQVAAQMDRDRIAMQERTAETLKQVDAWTTMAAKANTMTEVLKLHADIYKRLNEMRDEIEKTPMVGPGVAGFSGFMVDSLKANLNSLSEPSEGLLGLAQRIAAVTTGLGGLGSLLGEQEMSWEKAEKSAREALKIRETFAANAARHAVEQMEREKALAELPIEEQQRQLNDRLMEQQRLQSGMEKYGKQWRDQQIAIMDTEKAIEAVNAALEKLTASREREGEQLDANMRKEGEKFAKQEEAYARATAEAENQMSADAARYNAEQAREQEKEARDRERIEANNRRAFEQAEKETSRKKEREERDRLRYGIPEGGINLGGGAPARTGSLLSGGPGVGMESLRPHTAMPDASAANAALVQAAQDARDVVLSIIRAQTQATAALKDVKSRESIY